MIIDIEQTTAHAVARRMVELREAHGAIALGRVLTLVVLVDQAHAEEALSAASHASHEHPSRVLAVVAGSSEGPGRLDAQIRIGGDAGSGEVIVLRTFGPLVEVPQSVVIPLLLPDAPVVAWWPHRAPPVPAEHPVGHLAQRRITNVAEADDPLAALVERAVGYRPGDTDFAWTRITTWRALLAAALDQPPHEPVRAVTVAGRPGDPSVALLAQWLASTLGVDVARVDVQDVPTVSRVSLTRDSGDLVVEQLADETASLRAPGRAEHHAALPPRPDFQCLAEELRRLDPDEVYGEVLLANARRSPTVDHRPQ